MLKLELKMDIVSPALLGSGEGYGTMIDTDIVHDSDGLPYFPAKRLKGLLRESALEVLEMFEQCGIGGLERSDWNHAFGTTGKTSGHIHFHQLRFPDYSDLRLWIRWAKKNHPTLFTPDDVLSTLTSLRQLTAVDDSGVAKEGLRTVRVLNDGYSLVGKIHVEQGSDSSQAVNLLAYGCANLRNIGTMRTRGYGKVNCNLWQNGTNLTQTLLSQLGKGV